MRIFGLNIRASRAQGYAILVGRFLLISAALIPYSVAYPSAMTDEVRTHFQVIYWLMGIGLALTIPMMYLLTPPAKWPS